MAKQLIWDKETNFAVNSSLTNTGGGLGSEAGLALAHKAAGGIDTGVSQLPATLPLETTLIHIYRGESQLEIYEMYMQICGDWNSPTASDQPQKSQMYCGI